MRLYYAIAVCSTGGAYAPQSVLAALTELTPSQVNALLCTGGRPRAWRGAICAGIVEPGARTTS